MKYVLSISGGNDSVAMMQWAKNNGLDDCHVVYCNTGWASPSWPKRLDKVKRYADILGYEYHSLDSIGMEELVRIKKGFPGNAQQFCTAHLKGLPFLEWIENEDPDCQATVMIGKRRVESEKRKETQEFIDSSEYHGGRKVWHPLYKHTDAMRNELLRQAGFEPLPHRSQECNPCVNANRGDFLALTPGEIERVSALEVEIGQPMFRAKRFGALGIYGVIQWAKYGRDRGDIDEEQAQCDGLFGCGT